MKCLICDVEVKSLATHVKMSHKLDMQTYVDTYIYKGVPPTCNKCGGPLLFDNKAYYVSCGRCDFEFTCELCGYRTNSYNGLSQHVQKYHGSFKDYIDKSFYNGDTPKCDLCGSEKVFRKGQYVEECSKKCYNSLECKICGTFFHNWNMLSKHLNKAHDKLLKDYVQELDIETSHCVKCGRELRFERGHFVQDCDICDCAYYCQECAHGYEDRNAFSRHLRVDHDMTMRDYDVKYDNAPCCIQCRAPLEYRHGWPSNICSNCSYTITCQICGLQLVNMGSITLHLRNKHGLELQEYIDLYEYKGKPPTCPTCGKKLFFYRSKYTSWCEDCRGQAYPYYRYGHFDSQKNNRKLFHRSAFELRAFEILEADDTVISYEVESLKIPFNGSCYIPDILVTYSDTSKKLIEVKPADLLSDAVVQAKYETAKVYAQSNGITDVVFWTEKELFA
jgi:hypothetical protein